MNIFVVLLVVASSPVLFVKFGLVSLVSFIDKVTDAYYICLFLFFILSMI